MSSLSCGRHQEYCTFKLLFHFVIKFVLANRIASDGMPHCWVTSEAILLPMSYREGFSIMWVKRMIHVLVMCISISRCQNVLSEFLSGIKKSKSCVNFAGMANILIVHSQNSGKI